MAIKRYHEIARPGFNMWRPKGADRLIGIEFETEIVERTLAVDEVERILGDNFIPERDGSLSDRYGVEFVSRPLGYDVALSETGPVSSLINIINKYGDYSLNKRDVGMHVNVCCGIGDSSYLLSKAVSHLANHMKHEGPLVAGRPGGYSRYLQTEPDYPLGEWRRCRKESIAAMRDNHITGDWRVEFRGNKSFQNFVVAKTQMLYCITITEYVRGLLAERALLSVEEARVGYRAWLDRQSSADMLVLRNVLNGTEGIKSLLEDQEIRAAVGQPVEAVNSWYVPYHVLLSYTGTMERVHSSALDGGDDEDADEDGDDENDWDDEDEHFFIDPGVG